MEFERIRRSKDQKSQPLHHPEFSSPQSEPKAEGSQAYHSSHDIANISFIRPAQCFPPIQTRSANETIQRMSVKEATAKFEKIAAERDAQVKRDADIRKARAQKQQVGKPGAEPQVELSPPKTAIAESTAVRSEPVNELKVESPELTPPSPTNIDPEPTATRPSDKSQSLHEQVEENLKVLADGMFQLYEAQKNDPDATSKDDFKNEYDDAMRSAKQFLPDLIKTNMQDNPNASILLSFEQISDAYGNFNPSPLVAQPQPKATAKDRWHKLKKITTTDRSVSQVEGKSKSLTHKDIVSQVKTEKNTKVEDRYKIDTNHESYWLEAWDALHRPAFKLAGNDGDAGHFEDWLEESGMLEWLDERETRDKEMMDAFNGQKQQKGGVANFWEWKATSAYANPSSPPDTISFWQWLEQKGQKIEGVRYLESEPERRTREVKINGQWQDAFGDSLDSTNMLAIGAPGDGKGWAIFVMSPDGKFYVDAHTEGKYHHSSALAGVPVKGAGAIKLSGGTLQEICDKSGHYKPTAHQMYATIVQLNKNGVDPASYLVRTRDLGKMQGDKWLTKYLATQASNQSAKKYLNLSIAPSL
jgi:hypothetical protein